MQHTAQRAFRVHVLHEAIAVAFGLIIAACSGAAIASIVLFYSALH